MKLTTQCHCIYQYVHTHTSWGKISFVTFLKRNVPDNAPTGMRPKPGNQQHVLTCSAKAIIPASPCKVVRKRIVSLPQSLCIGVHFRLKCIYSGSLFRKTWLFSPQSLAQNSAQLAQFICNIHNSLKR